MCGPRIKFCALAQTWVVTKSLVSERGVIGSHHGESLCLFLVEVQIIMLTTNKQSRDAQPTTATPPSPSLASSTLRAVAASAARTRAAAVTALSAAKASVTRT